MLLMIDNYDSFTFNVVQALGELGAEVLVRRHDEVTLPEAEAMDPDGLLISPGPGTPADAGVSAAMIERFTGRIPILGICLGHQTIVEVCGGRVRRADRVMHGKTSAIYHDGHHIYAGLGNPFTATRYHSLIACEPDLPSCLEISAYTSEGEIMGIRHRAHPTEGVQFHPESILTGEGQQLLANWLDMCNGVRREAS
jgi:para-aminobenzoate synthetase component 2